MQYSGNRTFICIPVLFYAGMIMSEHKFHRVYQKRSESGRDIGYCVLHQQLTQKYNFVVGRFEQ